MKQIRGGKALIFKAMKYLRKLLCFLHFHSYKNVTLKVLINELAKKVICNRYKHKKCKHCNFSFMIDCESKKYIIRK